MPGAENRLSFCQQTDLKWLSPKPGDTQDVDLILKTAEVVPLLMNPKGALKNDTAWFRKVSRIRLCHCHCANKPR